MVLIATGWRAKIVEKAVFSLNGGTPLHSILELPERFPFDRIYIGTEICERMVMGKETLLAYLYATAEAGVRVTLVTPCHLSDAGLEAIDRQLDVLESVGIVDEVVFNDWGAMELICERSPLKPVLGRALHRMKRDPRVNIEELTEAELRVLRSSNITNETWRNYLRARGIERVECDNVPQGVDIDFKSLSLSASIYFPIIPVSFSRNCFQGATHRSDKARYSLNGSCRLECRTYNFAMENVSVVMVGKATYMVNESLDNITLQHFDRIVRVVP